MSVSKIELKLAYLEELWQLLDVVVGLQDYEWTMMRIKSVCESIERDLGIVNGMKSNVVPMPTAMLMGAGEVIEHRDGAPQE